MIDGWFFGLSEETQLLPPRRVDLASPRFLQALSDSGCRMEPLRDPSSRAASGRAALSREVGLSPGGFPKEVLGGVFEPERSVGGCVFEPEISFGVCVCLNPKDVLRGCV